MRRLLAKISDLALAAPRHTTHRQVADIVQREARRRLAAHPQHPAALPRHIERLSRTVAALQRTRATLRAAARHDAPRRTT
ncbi:hypothetical protein [Streptomyces lunalinharesii]|uniref:hypothetical protein n=1 Tax=Streptomyces lunalinharesii TaxID=333384 RepID=UPI0031D84D98